MQTKTKSKAVDSDFEKSLAISRLVELVEREDVSIDPQMAVD